ncbi:hypothetical protein C8J56DRAFT_1138327 [Mycena floridula]|nr:hypothetical protein C8J56DRAFT_1138327 [Mycena floridula]
MSCQDAVTASAPPRGCSCFQLSPPQPQICANCAYAGDSPTSKDVQLDRQLLNAGNSELTDAETRQVTADLVAHTARLETVEGSIAVLRRALENSEAEQRHLQHIIAEDKFILRPIRRVPPDILRIIFSLLAHTTLTKTPTLHSTLSMQKFMPWRLAQVSRTWRDVALTYPTLWSTIILTDENDDFDSKSTQRKFSLLGIQLYRAADTSLVIHIGSSRSLQPLIYLILPTSLRWRSLSILLPGDTSVLSAIVASTPRLESVNLSKPLELFNRLPPAQLIQRQSFINELLQFSSMLHSVEGDLSLLTDCHLPWNRIHSYREHTSGWKIPSRQDFSGLARMINLQSCTLFCNFNPGSSSSVSLPNLLHLFLDGGNLKDMIIVLNALSLPRLCTLKTAEWASDNSFTSLLPRYSALKGLHIASTINLFPLPVNGLTSILFASPNLTALVVDVLHEHVGFVDHLVRTPAVGHALTFLAFAEKSMAGSSGSYRLGDTHTMVPEEHLVIARPGLRVHKAASGEPLALPDNL